MKKNFLLIGSSGYIGSYLKSRFNDDEIFCIDILEENIEFLSKKIRYQELDVGFLEDFDYVLFFAGISSVPMANSDPKKAIYENLIDLFEFSKKCGQAKTFLIYASSGSVFADDVNHESLNFYATESNFNSYDASKQAFDLIIKYAGVDFLGLRLGTVSGFSPKLRNELIFNSMCLSAIKNNYVKVSSGSSFRGILFLSDLFLMIQNLINSNKKNITIPCVSYNGSIKQIGTEIANYFDVPLINNSDNETTSYSFILDDKFSDINRDSIMLQCKKFAEEYKKNEK